MDRSKPPSGYRWPATTDEDEGPDTGYWPNIGGPCPTQEEAIAACWAHRDRMAAQAIREEAVKVIDKIASMQRGIKDDRIGGGVLATLNYCRRRLLDRADRLDGGTEG